MSRNKVLEDKNQIIDMAFQIMDCEGEAALSARRLAKSLGISSMTLYNYVKNIDDIRREIVVRSFNLLFQRVYEMLAAEKEKNAAAFARCYALALYDFAAEHPFLCEYLEGGGRKRFYGDVELRPFYKPFEHVGAAFVRCAAGVELQRAFRMFECAVLCVIQEQVGKIRTMEREEFSDCVDLLIGRLFPGGAAG